MTDEIENTDLPLESELDALKARADQMGISYHPSIGADKLRDKIDARLIDSPKSEPLDDPEVEPEEETTVQRNKRLKDDASRLVRVRITNMNPNKREYDGEIFTVGNGVVGTFRKYVPFDTDWHIPNIMLDMIQTRQCQVFATVTDRTTGKKSRKGKLVKEFSVEILPPLTEQELKDLAQRQAMANGTSDA